MNSLNIQPARHFASKSSPSIGQRIKNNVNITPFTIALGLGGGALAPSFMGMYINNDESTNTNKSSSDQLKEAAVMLIAGNASILSSAAKENYLNSQDSFLKQLFYLGIPTAVAGTLWWSLEDFADKLFPNLGKKYPILSFITSVLINISVGLGLQVLLTDIWNRIFRASPPQTAPSEQ